MKEEQCFSKWLCLEIDSVIWFIDLIGSPLTDADRQMAHLNPWPVFLPTLFQTVYNVDLPDASGAVRLSFSWCAVYSLVLKCSAKCKIAIFLSGIALLHLIANPDIYC